VEFAATNVPPWVLDTPDTNFFTSLVTTTGKWEKGTLGTLDPGQRTIWGVHLHSSDRKIRLPYFTGDKPPYGLIFTLGDPDSGHAVILKRKLRYGLTWGPRERRWVVTIPFGRFVPRVPELIVSPHRAPMSKPHSNDISIGKSQWIRFFAVVGREARAACFDHLSAPLESFWSALETNCIAECCGMDAFSLWPEDVRRATSTVDAKLLADCLTSVREFVENS
jgi:hypothetical protein